MPSSDSIASTSAGITAVTLKLYNTDSSCAGKDWYAVIADKTTANETSTDTHTLTTSPATYTWHFTGTIAANIFDYIDVRTSDGCWASHKLTVAVNSSNPKANWRTQYAPSYAMTTDDIYLVVDAAPPDPRIDPVVTTIRPTGAYSSGIVSVPQRVFTNVCANDYPDANPYYETLIEKNSAFDGSGSWTTYATATSADFGFRFANDDVPCDTGLSYALGGFPDPTLGFAFPNGLYRSSTRVTFEGFDPGAYSDTVEFSLTSSPVGGGGGGSWGTDGGGASGFTTWSDALDALPDHDTAVGACDFWGTASADGLACVWSWVRYAIFPPETVDTVDFLSLPMNTLSSRWPFNYVTSMYASMASGLTATSCPFSDALTSSDDLMGANLPTISVCDWFQPIPDLFNDNALASVAVVTLLWVGFASWVFKETHHFFES